MEVQLHCEQQVFLLCAAEYCSVCSMELQSNSEQLVSLLCAAEYCSVLKCVAVFCIVLQRGAALTPRTAGFSCVSCSVLQCNVWLQHHEQQGLLLQKSPLYPRLYITLHDFI